MSFKTILNKTNFDLEFKNSSYDHGGHCVPRVTEILSKTIHNDALLYWANSLGFKRQGYRATLNKAAAIGTSAHSNIERYLKEKEYDDTNIPFQGFLEWWENALTNNHSVAILGQEEKLTCQWFGGTYDLLLSIDGKPYLVDFKTSNHISVNYFLQLAAYSILLWENKGIVPEGFIVLQLDKNVPAYEEYMLCMDIESAKQFMSACTDTFWSLVCSYYYTTNIEKEFNTLFKGKKGVIDYEK